MLRYQPLIQSEISNIDQHSIYHYIKETGDHYPDFFNWYYLKVIPGLLTGDRKILIETRDKDLKGIAIVKYSEKKICHLNVMNIYKGSGAGIKLFERCFQELNTRRPFLTISEEKLLLFKRIISYYDFKLTSVRYDLYRKNKKEYFYNEV